MQKTRPDPISRGETTLVTLAAMIALTILVAIPLGVRLARVEAAAA